MKFTHDKDGAIIPVDGSEVSFITSFGENSMTVKVGGVEIVISVADPDPGMRYPQSEVKVDVSVPGELDPEVFRISEQFGTVSLGVYKAGKAFSYKDLHPRNKYS